MKKIGIVLIVLVLFVSVIIFINKKSDKKANKSMENMKKENFIFNEETSKYEVYDDSGKLIIETKDRAEAEFYQENPDYNPNPLSSPITDLDSELYMNFEYELNNEIE